MWFKKFTKFEQENKVLKEVTEKLQDVMKKSKASITENINHRNLNLLAYLKGMKNSATLLPFDCLTKSSVSNISDTVYLASGRSLEYIDFFLVEYPKKNNGKQLKKDNLLFITTGNGTGTK